MVDFPFNRSMYSLKKFCLTEGIHFYVNIKYRLEWVLYCVFTCFTKIKCSNTFISLHISLFVVAFFLFVWLGFLVICERNNLNS